MPILITFLQLCLFLRPRPLERFAWTESHNVLKVLPGQQSTLKVVEGGSLLVRVFLFPHSLALDFDRLRCAHVVDNISRMGFIGRPQIALKRSQLLLLGNAIAL